MTEKRFTIHKESKYKEEWYAYPFCIKEEGEVVLETIPLSIAEKVRDKLNEQQDTIGEQKIAIDELITDYKKLEEEKVELMEDCACQYKQIQKLESENEDLREVNKETVKQCERWKNLYELKDAEVTARVDALNKVCEYYTSKVLFKSDVDPNRAVKEVINEILNTPIYEEG